jgi:transmembrane protein TMEM43
MPDVYTQTTTQGFFSRLFGSVIGLLLGPVLIIVAVGLLWWNEGRAVTAITGLNAAASLTVEASTFSPTHDGKLVHAVGPVTAQAKIADGDVGLSFDGQAAVARTAEMYQWREKEETQSHDNVGGSKTTTTTYTYTKEWSSTASDSGNFKHPEGHANPAMPFASTRWAASDAKLNGYTLDAATLAVPDLQTTLAFIAPAGWARGGDYLYKGDASAPKIGDMRVSYKGLASGDTISVLAAQSAGGFAPFTTANGYRIDLVDIGNAPADMMIAEKRKAESTLTWILRGAGAIAMFAGFALFLGPISTLASVLPFLGGLVRGAAGAAAFVISVPLTLAVIALAWIGHRPLIGGGLLLAAAAIFYALWRWHSGRRPAVPAKA